MASLKAFMEISNVPGVDQYILTDAKSKIITHAINNPEKAAAIVLSCGRTSYRIGKGQFRHLIFFRKNQKNLFIFRVGNYYLGVIKKSQVDNSVLTENILKFLKGLG